MADLVVATWNVNSIKARLAHLCSWLRQASPDVVLLQETKVVAEGFPMLEIADAGYNAVAVGQKSYNGVAVLSKRPIDVLETTLPGDPDDTQARYLEVFTGDLRVASLYAPNGNPVGSDKFTYKLAFLDRLFLQVREVLSSEDAFVLGGDFNVAPTDDDVFDTVAMREDALCQPESRARYRRLLHLGLTDALRAYHPEPRLYTWWDYRAGAFANNHGLRIDHLLLSPQAADRLQDAQVDRAPRSWDRASDHTPVLCRLAGG